MLENKEWDRNLMPRWMQIEMDNSGESIQQYLESRISGPQRLIEDLTAARSNAVSELEKKNEELAEEIKSAETAPNDTQSAPDTGKDGVVNKAEMLTDELEKLEHEYKIHNVTEAEYWAERKRLLELYRDDNSEEWHDYDVG